MRPSIQETIKKSHYGRCRICQRIGRFTKEHVPPKGSGNKGIVVVSKPKTNTSPNRVSMRPEYESFDGIFIYSLCDRCNNKTGNRYGADYSRFADIVGRRAAPAIVNQNVSIAAPSLHPLRIVKQATSMMLSTSNPTDFRRHEYVSSPGKNRADLNGIEINYPEKEWLNETYEKLRRFVRQRDTNDFPSGVQVSLFASVGKRIGFRTGIFTHVNLNAKSAVFMAATGLFPLHWFFTFKSQSEGGILDVTNWTTCGYKEPFEKDVEVPMRWLEGHYPTDFRSPQNLLTYNFIHSMEMEGFVPSIANDLDKLLEEALFFARTLGKETNERFLISSFSTGTFYEFGPVNGWLPDGDTSDAIKALEFRLKAQT